jgi:hypothetical protein
MGFGWLYPNNCMAYCCSLPSHSIMKNIKINTKVGIDIPIPGKYGILKSEIENIFEIY